LQTGWRGGIGWQDIEISSRESGAPFLILHGQVQELFAKSGATVAHLSMSHTSEHAIAEVVLEK
jgi:holo-[acyl-carrier protein] synthase